MRNARSALLVQLSRARQRGYLGPGDLELHIDHAMGFARAVEAELGCGVGPGSCTPGRRAVLDLGSGGGIPGLVLADLWPDSKFMLLDSNLRKTEFLISAVEACGMSGRVCVKRESAEVAGMTPELRASFDVVVARSFGRPATTAECASPLIVHGGILVVSEPPPGDDDLDQDRWPDSGLAQLGMSTATSWRDTFGYQVIRQTSECPARFPRRVGVARKNPLF